MPDALVIGCDSVLELDGAVHGKPADADEARARWRAMRGRSGVLHTGHCLVDTGSGTEVARSADTVVHFADLGDDEIDAYVATGEPLKVAGAFTLDGLGGAFVRGIEGDPHTVVGIGLPLLREMFAEVGVRWTDLWRAFPAPEHVEDGAPHVGACRARDRRYSISAPAKTSVLNAPASATWRKPRPAIVSAARLERFPARE